MPTPGLVRTAPEMAVASARGVLGCTGPVGGQQSQKRWGTSSKMTMSQIRGTPKNREAGPQGENSSVECGLAPGPSEPPATTWPCSLPTGAPVRHRAEVQVSTVRTPRVREATQLGKGPVGVASLLRAASLHPVLGHAGTARHLLSPPRPSPQPAPKGFPSPGPRQ